MSTNWRLWMTVSVGAACLAIASNTDGWAEGHQDDSTPAREYEALVAEYRGAIAGRRPAGSRGIEDFARRFLALARKHLDDPAAFDALAWVVLFGFTTPEAEEAADLLSGRHPDDPRLWPLCQELTRTPMSPARGRLLRTVLEAGPDRKARGRACYLLAQFLQEEAGFVRLLRTPGLKPWQAQFLTDRKLATSFRNLDPDALSREAETLLKRVSSEFADVRPVTLTPSPTLDGDARRAYGREALIEQDKGTLGELARADLDELRRLDVGRVAPEIEAQDAAGVSFKLSDYRGKVVVLTFSGDWCGPCQAMYPHLRELTARHKGRPFALLSVNTDETRDQLRESIRSGRITWRCWWEPAGPNGGIPALWHVRGWPTVYILDHEGTIRLKFTGLLTGPVEGQPPIDQVIEALLTKAGPAKSPRD
jgi:thiol-disulfide isomerase/thioredoxin